jgi:hypothetical protein
VRALGVDAAVERLLLEALTPDRLALAIAALGELENEARALEHQWLLKRERARYEAERARRQYDAVEPENRLVARSLERVWEDKLRQAEKIDIEYESWRQQQPVSLAAADRAQILSLGADLPKLWGAASAVERKQILRLVMKEVILDHRPTSGQVWIRVIWQTGAVSEHKIRRNVNSYRNYADIAALESRVRDLVAAQKMDREIATTLNAEGLLSARGWPFSSGEVHLLRRRWNIPTVKINGAGHNPPQWPDGTYSVQGAAAALSISTQTVFKWLEKGRLLGQQLAKGMPWQITLSSAQIALAEFGGLGHRPPRRHQYAVLGLVSGNDSARRAADGQPVKTRAMGLPRARLTRDPEGPAPAQPLCPPSPAR